jgi:type IV fimbrial biogenesis protein FimT
MKSPSLPRSAGFTIFELVMVMAIIGILAGIGVSSYKYVTAANRISAEINAMLADIRYARSESVREGLPVTICTSTDGATCTGGNTWQSGWIVFSDPAATQTAPASTTSLLRIQPSFSTSYNSTDLFNSNDGHFTALTFNREGFGTPVGPIGTNLTATVTMELKSNPANQRWTRCMVVTAIGMASIESAPASAYGSNCT